MTQRLFLILSALALCSACGSKHEARSAEDVAATENAGRVEATTDSERAILESLNDLPAGTPRTVGRETVTAETPYFAASGQRCRQVSWTANQRLACQEPAGWYFVPDVFEAAKAP